MDYETNTARLVMLTLICVVVVISSDALATSASEQEQSKSHVSAARVISFSGGRVVVQRQNNLDHVTVTDNAGKLQSESWCPLESGSYDELLTFFKRFVAALAVADTDTVVLLVRYPLRVNRAKNIEISDPETLLHRYAEVFNPAVVKQIRNTAPEAIFCRNSSAMIGNGIVWAHAERGHVALDVLNK
jgi:hypothetical protein